MQQQNHPQNPSQPSGNQVASQDLRKRPPQEKQQQQQSPDQQQQPGQKDQQNKQP